MIILGLITSFNVYAAHNNGQDAPQQTASNREVVTQALKMLREGILEPLTGAMQSGIKAVSLPELQSLTLLQRWAAEQRAKRAKKVIS